MSNLIIFIVGVAVTLVVGMGVITSQIFIAYKTVDEKKRDLIEPIEDTRNLLRHPIG
jgi:hypothetical protein